MKNPTFDPIRILDLKQFLSSDTLPVTDNELNEFVTKLKSNDLATFKDTFPSNIFETLEDYRIEHLKDTLKDSPNRTAHWTESFNDDPDKFANVKTYPYLIQSKKVDEPDTPLPCFENTEYFVSKIIDSTCAINEMNGEAQLYCPLFSTNDYSVAINLMHSKAIINNYKRSFKDFERDIASLCDQRSFHPVKTWIESKAWDKVDRIKPLLASLITDTPDMRDMLVTKWLIAGIAALYSPNGVDSQGILILQGEGGLGKSLWFSKLCHIEAAIGSHKLILDKKDSLMECLKFWIVELAEIEGTFKKSDVADLKAFIDRKSDVYRKLFAKNSANHYRRTILCGSGNNDTPLTDPTGNRKYWPIAITGTVKDWFVGFDFQQLWAQVKEELYLKGVDYHLTDDERSLLNIHNLAFTQDEPIEELMKDRFIKVPTNVNNYNFKIELLNASKIFARLYPHGKPTKLDLNNIGRACRKITGKDKPDQIRSKSYWLIDLDYPTNDVAKAKYYADLEKGDNAKQTLINSLTS